MFPKDPPIGPYSTWGVERSALVQALKNGGGCEGNHGVVKYTEHSGLLVLGGGAALLTCPASTEPQGLASAGLGVCFAEHLVPPSCH